MLSHFQIDQEYLEFVPFGLAVLRGALNGATCAQLTASLKHSSTWRPLHFGTYENGELTSLDTTASDVNALVNYEFAFPADFEAELKDAVATLANELWQIRGGAFSPFTASQMSTGMALGIHRDSRFADTSRIISVVVYLGDDFVGGKLNLPELGISVQPKTGDAIIFFSEHEHLVTKVISGNRYSGVFFIEK